MSAQPLDELLRLYNICQKGGLERDERKAFAQQLSDLGLLSARNIASIVGLDHVTVGKVIQKKDRTGGRLNPETIPLLHDLWMEYGNDIKNAQLARTIVSLGTSTGVISSLVGIPLTSVKRMVDKGTEAQE